MAIDYYGWGTPNGRKISIMLEEVDLPYRYIPIDITKGDQHAPEFLKISPNNKIPAIVDDETGMSLFESGAILLYLAEKTGLFLPKEAAARWLAMQWLMWQMGGFGPMLGQTHHFKRFAKEKLPYAIERYDGETRRLYGVLDRRLGEARFLAGEEYGVADIATWPWAARYEWQEIDLADHPNVQRWFEAIGARPAVQRGMAIYG